MSASATHELILGGQKSGKSRTAEARAQAWLEVAGRDALLLATAEPGDAEMSARIERHRLDRRRRSPALETLEVGQSLAAAIRSHSAPHRLLVVDCLTLWLAQAMFPLAAGSTAPDRVDSAIDEVLVAARLSSGPWIVVSNEIGFGVVPASTEARAFVDRLGLMHQTLAAIVERVTLMVAGCECRIKGAP